MHPPPCLILDILGRLANRPQLLHPRPHNICLLGGHDLPLPHPGDEQVSDGPLTNSMPASILYLYSVTV